MEDLTKIWEEMNFFLDKKIEKETKYKNYICDCDEKDQELSEISGSIICVMCGIVIEARIISDEAEWGNYNNDDGGNTGANMVRCSAPIDPLFPSFGNSSYIRGDKKMNLLNQYINIDYKDRVIYHIKMDLYKIFTINNLPHSIIQETLFLYKKITSGPNSYRAKNKKAVLASCVYYTAKYRNIHISSNKILEIFSIDERLFSKFCKILKEEYIDKENIKNNQGTEYKNSLTKVYKISELIEGYCISLNIPFKTISLCKKISIAIENLKLFINVYPMGMIAGIIFFTTDQLGYKLDKTIISEKCNTSLVNMLKSYKEVKNQKNTIFLYIKNQ